MVMQKGQPAATAPATVSRACSSRTPLMRRPCDSSIRRASGETTEVVGLLDTGAAVNVLPYPVGLALGADWDQQIVAIPLTGSLGSIEARALVVLASHPQLTLADPIRLVFAWTRIEDAPVIFGQTNFFMEFDVCFYCSQAASEVHVCRMIAGSGSEKRRSW